jgi:hypothetical protein
MRDTHLRSEIEKGMERIAGCRTEVVDPGTNRWMPSRLAASVDADQPGNDPSDRHVDRQPSGPSNRDLHRGLNVRPDA